MKVEVYQKLMAMQASRRSVLKGAAALGATTMLSGLPTQALSDNHAKLRAEILKIPGVGAGSPTDADWQKVGELCLGGGGCGGLCGNLGIGVGTFGSGKGSNRDRRDKRGQTGKLANHF